MKAARTDLSTDTLREEPAQPSPSSASDIGASVDVTPFDLIRDA